MDIKTLYEEPPWDWPEDAARTIGQTLLNSRADEQERLMAAELAGNLVAINDDLAGVLLSTIANPADPEPVRAKAAISLGPVLEQGSITEFDDPEDVPIPQETFERIQQTLETLYADESFPKEVRRRILEASVRDPRDWHNPAILSAYNSGDRDWILSAVFSMGCVRGFDKQIIESLSSSDPEIHFEAVDAAGTWEIDQAYPHVLALVNNPKTPKPLIFAAIEAVAAIRPDDAPQVLDDLLDSADEELREVAQDAISMATGVEVDDDWGDEDEEDEEEGGSKDWVN